MIFENNHFILFIFTIYILLNIYLNKISFFIFFILIILLFILSQIIEFNFFIYISIIIFIIIINNFKIKIESLLLINFILLSLFIILFYNNLILIFLSIEIQTFSLLILISSNKNNIKSLEAGLKYFILSSISSGFFLLGLTCFFKTSSILDLNLINFLFNKSNIFYSTGYIILIISLLFKLGLAPFHYWIADIYEGSSYSLILLLSSLPKLSIFILLIKFNDFYEIIMIFGVISILIGAIAGFNQTKIKRLIAYSGISNFGFVILSLSLNNIIGLDICLLYFFIYNFTNLFIVVIFLNFKNNIEYIIELNNSYINNKFLSISLLITIFSIAGIPPLLGFLSKFIIITTLINYNYMIIGCFILLITSIGIGFYLRIINIIYFQNNNFYISWKNIININNNILYLDLLNIGFVIYFTLFYLFNPKFFISYIFFFNN